MPYQADANEKEILEFWQKNKIFERSVNERPADKPYVFYDGPPFATGLPHYGHILSSVIKDVVPRYWTMKGYRVRRRWGWDCHGLPIESLIEKELKIGSKKEIEEKIGVEKFNEACRSKVLMYTREWKKMVDRIGRWVEFDNAYQTMDASYIESIWWALKNLWGKDMIYEGLRVLPYCPHCETPVSKAEVAMDNSYKDVTDASVIVKFRIIDEAFLKAVGNGMPTSLVAWTTTPWSIPTTMGLAVGEEFNYVLVRVADEQIICAQARLDYVTEGLEAGTWTIVKELSGKDLVGVRYLHPFSEYASHPDVVNNPRVYMTYGTDYVSMEDGTGIVTINGAFGEIDYETSQKLGLPVVINIGPDGRYDESMGALADKPVKPKGNPREMDLTIGELLRERGALWRQDLFQHSYPHCWRCESPLIYRAIPAWFINIQKIKPRLIELNQKINWYPKHLKEGRFLDILETAPDWNISRNRYWASPLPFWKCNSESQKCSAVCVGSVKELKEKATNFSEVFPTDNVAEIDLHKHVVDKIKLRCDQCGGAMERVPEVIDCWVESGSMPYAEFHYPFENKEIFEQRFPGQYIAEYIGQVRAWFYYMHIVSVLLFDNISFENVVTTGTILNEKGEKLSKSKQNYPDPWKIIEVYGVDALRFYLMTSVVMQADDLFFSEREVRETYNKVVNILWNVVEFYHLYADESSPQPSPARRGGLVATSRHVLDRWIVARLNQLVKEVTEHMDRYDTVRAGRLIKEFIDELSTWYVRRSRDRFKGEDEADKHSAIATLREVLLTLSKIMAPFTPFLAEKIYQELRIKNQESGNGSVHLEDWPVADSSLIGEQLLADMVRARKLVEMGLSLRKEQGIRVRQPLPAFSVQRSAFSDELKQIIADELNVKEVRVVDDVTAQTGRWVETESAELQVALNIDITPELKKEGLARELIRAMNQLRKDAGLQPSDDITIYYQTSDAVLAEVLAEYREEITLQTRAKGLMVGEGQTMDFDGHVLQLAIQKF